MKVKYITVEEQDEDQRLDNFLIKQLKGVPKSHVYRIIRKGEIRVDKKRAKAHTRLNPGMVVRIPPLAMSAERKTHCPDGLKEQLNASILVQDERVIVLNKPCGIAVHGGSGLSFGVIEALRNQAELGGYLELVHRLDRETSGCLIVAKKRSVLRELHRQMAANEVTKRYWALLHQSWTGAQRRLVEAPLLKNTLKSGERVVRIDAEGKQAVSEFRLVRNFPQCCLVEVRLLTGRTHQIRVHAKHINHPIIGDDKYGINFINKQFRQKGLSRLFLHARDIEFTLGDKQYKIRAPLPRPLSQLLDRLEEEA